MARDVGLVKQRCHRRWVRIQILYRRQQPYHEAQGWRRTRAVFLNCLKRQADGSEQGQGGRIRDALGLQCDSPCDHFRISFWGGLGAMLGRGYLWHIDEGLVLAAPPSHLPILEGQ